MRSSTFQQNLEGRESHEDDLAHVCKQEMLLPTRSLGGKHSCSLFYLFLHVMQQVQESADSHPAWTRSSQGTATLPQKRTEVNSRKALAWHVDSSEVDRPATSGSAPGANGPVAPVSRASAYRCDEPHSATTSGARVGKAR